ncbi:hypothetical protein CRYUN_Cryun02cG0163100 [Craigia yunnanensis]
MGGSGKTTLVANIFNKRSVKQHFDFCIWITVSQQYSIEELFRSMVKDVYKQRKEVPMQVDTMSYRVLVDTLVQYLQSRRYLIVLDDVWNIEFWQEIHIALPEGMRGSRIMFTTRREDVAPLQFGFVSYIHLIQPLRKDEAWELFCKKAFPNKLGGCPPHLDPLGRKLVEKSEGLPLAIVALGGLMSSKKSIADWRRVHDNLNWELSNNAALELVKTISLLSYHDLSFQLKHCFLYCFIFPEDYAIRQKRLIRLWMAEGLLEQVNDAPPEAVADSYLMELISRSLLQVTMRNHFGRPKAIKMHDLIREFAVSIAKEEKLVAVSDEKKGEESGIRRYSIEVKDKEMKLGNGTAQLRSLIIFVVDEISKSSFNKLPSGFKLLRVLDLANAPINELPIPPYLEKLHLIGKLEKVPHWFNTLLNLNRLSLQDTELREDHVLSLTQSLPNLSYLSLSANAFEGERLYFVEGFQKLKILKIRRCPQLHEIMMEKGVMPGLQVLHVLRCKELRRLPYGWEHLTHLEEVRLYDVSDELVQSICGNRNGDLPTTPYILLTRTDDDDDEAKSKLLSEAEAIHGQFGSKEIPVLGMRVFPGCTKPMLRSCTAAKSLHSSEYRQLEQLLCFVLTFSMALSTVDGLQFDSD